MTSEPRSGVRLPKRVEADPRAAELAAVLDSRPRVLWSGGRVRTPVVELGDALARSLKGAHIARRITRGLEGVEEKLVGESRGLDQADQKAGAERGQRVSRLILLSNDGAERLYRRVESLLRRFPGRLLVIQLEADSTRIGAVFSTDGSTTKVLMLDHKDAVADALLALAVRDVPEPPFDATLA